MSIINKMINVNTVLRKAMTANEFKMPEEAFEKSLQFLDMLLRWNKVFRLTAINTLEQAIWLHLMDSFSIHPFIEGQRILDVGSGGGLPGIPLALICPDRQFVLLDSNGKKTRFLQQVVLDLHLSNVTVVQSRVEDYRVEFGFDTITTRAFSTLSVMLEKTHHLLNESGSFLAMKGVCPQEEINMVPAEFISTVHRVSIKGLDAERHVVCIRKQ